MLRIGTCSWKYDSWKGIIYPDKDDINYLKEYSKHYKTFEVDKEVEDSNTSGCKKKPEM